MTTFTELTVGPPDRPAADAPPPATPPNLVDAQRDALRDLVALATESAATEARIDRELAVALAKAAETFDTSTATVRQRYDALAAQAKQKHAAARQQVADRQAAAAAQIRQFEEPARREAQATYEQTKAVVDKKIGEATWLAESDWEVTTNTLAAEKKKLEAAVAADLVALDGAHRQALQQAVQYGYRPPGGQPDAVAEPAEADVAFDLTTDYAAKFEADRAEVDAGARALAAQRMPQFFIGVMPVVVVIVVAGIAAGAAWAATGLETPNYTVIGAAAGGAALLTIVLGAWMRSVSRRHVSAAFDRVTAAEAAARVAAAARLKQATAQRETARERAAHKRQTEIKFATEKYSPAVANAKKKLDATLAAVQTKAAEGRANAEADIAKLTADVEAKAASVAEQIAAKRELDLKGATLYRQRQESEAKAKYASERAALETRLKHGLATITAPIDASAAAAGRSAPADWESPEWATWKPAASFAPAVKVGSLTVDLLKVATAAGKPPPRKARQEQADDLHAGFHQEPDHHSLSMGLDPAAEEAEQVDDEAADDDHPPTEVRLTLPPPFELPAALAFPARASLLVQADRDGRADAVRAVQMAMSRLLVSLPAGRVRFTLIDPVGLGQNFAGFMHLADHDDQLVGGRIWTETDQIDQRLNDLTGHMETIIQKYLRNEFETIDDYNAQAGELAEPYRFLVVSDFPASFTDEALRRLSAVASSGARCGVYTIVHHDTRLPLPHGSTVLEDLAANSVVFVQEDGRFVWRDEVFSQFPLSLDPPPSELSLTKILDKVGKAAKEAARVEVPFETIAPPAGQFWSQDSGGDVHVPVGRTGATRLQQMRLGKGVAQHVLIAGKTGSGKSTLLHALVTNLALWYPPDQVEFYLVDFKKGVEFKTYATYALPHARAIAVESDREFGLSVLQRLDAELTRRGEIYRAVGVQDLASYRKSPNPQVMPRTLLIVDEFQEFFSEDDKLAQESSVLLDRLVRQGRAFGIHVLLGSQTIAGAGGLPRSTIGQMAVRIALMTSEADSQLILGDNNSAARLLSRPGEAIYNDQGGLVEGNSPFQVSWLSDERKDRYLAQIRKAADERGVKMTPPIVFEGNAPADLSKNAGLAALLDGVKTPGPLRAWVGEPVAIKDATFIPLRRQSGANVLIIGQAEESSLATVVAMMVSLAAQVNAREPRGSAPGPDESESSDAGFSSPRFYVLDATPADSTLAGTFTQVKDALPKHDVRLVEWRSTEAAINELATELARRRDAQDLSAPPTFLFVYGLQRYRVLRKAEDDFSFGSGGDDKPADPGKQFAEILKDGPAHGIHVVAWADTATAVDRTLDRGSLREFDTRVLFQMSANDSSNLIDSPAANRLGFHRALAYSEEQGVMEKFRPYGLPTAAFLEAVKAKMG